MAEKTCQADDQDHSSVRRLEFVENTRGYGANIHIESSAKPRFLTKHSIPPTRQASVGGNDGVGNSYHSQQRSATQRATAAFTIASMRSMIACRLASRRRHGFHRGLQTRSKWPAQIHLGQHTPIGSSRLISSSDGLNTLACPKRQNVRLAREKPKNKLSVSAYFTAVLAFVVIAGAIGFIGLWFWTCIQSRTARLKAWRDISG